MSKQLAIPCGWNFPSKHNCDGRGNALRVWNWESANASDGHSASGLGPLMHLGTTGGGHARNVTNPQSSRRNLSARCKLHYIDAFVTRWLRCRNLLTRSLVPPIYRTTDRAPTQQRMRGQHAAQLPNGRCSRLRRLRVLPARLSVLGARPSTSLCALGLCHDPLSPRTFILV